MSKCCFCGKEVEYKVNVNDPRPIRVKGEEMPICCNECNARIVVPTRVAVWGMEKDLKEKLAESEKLNKVLYNEKESAEKILRMSSDEQTIEILALKQQLAEKEKEIEDMKIDLEAKDFNINTLMEQRKRKQKFYNKSKIEFAVEQLEKVKNYIIGNETYTFGDYPIVYVEDMTEAIDNQIKQLKEME